MFRLASCRLESKLCSVVDMSWAEAGMQRCVVHQPPEKPMILIWILDEITVDNTVCAKPFQSF